MNNKSSRTEYILGKYLTWQLKKHFYRVYIHNQHQSSDKARLYIMNHSSWWDGLIVFYLNRYLLHEDAYAMMSRDGIEKFTFFSKIGAFPVDPESPKSLIRSLQFADQLLKDQKSVWIFPQGKEEHLDKRPLSFMNGPAYLAEKNPDAEIIPVSACYTFRHDQRPELFITIGQPIQSEALTSLNRKEKSDVLRQSLEQSLDQMKADIINEELHHFKGFVKGFKTSSEWLEALKRK
ncbi:lysophospholipid acyltransferase family protein [Jeotgalibacillus haloalkalitolerans]|uniref:Lysophospholipid acyltransferase family protein n=1 Tax=Jeotgalibacillus haloalkalitolerans TaxID=3104292 RepID=A0ABU5KKZ0_9BACL|nr:lysophospholipid acyltransferase family protein [Jeotgalibacillus sp. HH7-29]MDZ5711927.1 lysophospholipid acyltransferase family protein [Jeotgalibacillus sp. HH7-29]